MERANPWMGNFQTHTEEKRKTLWPTISSMWNTVYLTPVFTLILTRSKSVPALFSKRSHRRNSSVSYPIFCWRCPNLTRSWILLQVLSIIKPKAMLACSLKASTEGKKEEGGSLGTGAWIGGARIGNGNIMYCNRWGLGYFFFEKR